VVSAEAKIETFKTFGWPRSSALTPRKRESSSWQLKLREAGGKEVFGRAAAAFPKLEV
jgi:hypothetical protein